MDLDPLVRMVSCCDITWQKVIFDNQQLSPSTCEDNLGSHPSSLLCLSSTPARSNLSEQHTSFIVISPPASNVASITENAPLKYVVDSISLGDTQQVGYDLLAPGGQLATFLPGEVPAAVSIRIVVCTSFWSGIMWNGESEAHASISTVFRLAE